MLREAGFDGEGVRARSVPTALCSPARRHPHARAPAPGVEPLGPLIRLFVLDASTTADEARRALAPLSLERLGQLGLLERGGGEVRSRVRIVPHDDVLVVSDGGWCPAPRRGRITSPACMGRR